MTNDGYNTDTDIDNEDRITREEMFDLLKRRHLFFTRVGVSKVAIEGEIINPTESLVRIVQGPKQPMFISPSYYSRNAHLKPLLYTSPTTGKKYYAIAPTRWCNSCFVGYHDDATICSKCNGEMIPVCHPNFKFPVFAKNGIPCAGVQGIRSPKHITRYTSINGHAP